MGSLNMICVRKEYFWILFFYAALTDGAVRESSVCQVNSTVANESSGISISTPVLMRCPGPHDPLNHTACCYNGEGEDDQEEESQGGARCCVPPAVPVGVFYIDDQLAMIIALSVTTVCVIITIIIIVCCFWSRCPLYTACRIRYHQDDIIAYASKDEETAGLNDMPPEETKGVTIYSPNAVKVTMKDDV
ncbi:uncharacterized protein LOC125026611 [Penaeus chinensis]|uniref:uncharacterized protein LOC125026611 n=1 Tax=Penaeus chinensis TaxID=139456 RepID=UPI001FB78857|nr:uncharacterized protein LOC125026611 [Penaeus chinensis]